MRHLVLLFLLLATGCQTQAVTSIAGSDAAEPALCRPGRAWELVDGDRVVGMVVEFQVEDGRRRFFSVRNSFHQELGLIDAVGRAFRFEPHEREAGWIGSGTVIEGAARLLGIEGDAELFEVRLEALREEGREAALPRSG